MLFNKNLASIFYKLTAAACKFIKVLVQKSAKFTGLLVMKFSDFVH